jgi:type I restriction enzyme M protein
MLDSDTKRRIDTARDILVGKVPDPKSQVEQITIALIYKFMDDMDAEAEELGGKRKFFTKDFGRYGWAKLMSPGIGGAEMLALYSDGIAKMPENPGIPPLFRDIFKNAYLPYRDPETLKAFLKIINEFTYDHSERLGDAFEYLLSVLGSQGDAGQFRTPRHIIDFMVAVLDPQKGETILDPACGTAGFLISAYKHILANNRINRDKQDGQDKKNKSCESSSSMFISSLTPDDKGRLAKNFKGYDISPDMVRLSLVNLYLHGFTDPHVYEYDTLTSEERWNEFADVILANPPFMSPKGGIKPHKRFSIQAKRSEVLFVDYMAEHLTPKGRAAIIVPEGIIFQSQDAYKALRKMLVENSLVAVVSLPAGCFNPYSGVKTSILFLDKTLAKRSDTVAFFKVENDGFGLGAQRRAIEKNDLPQVQAELTTYLNALRSKSPTAFTKVTTAQIVSKEKIAVNGDYNLSGERYRDGVVRNNIFPIVSLGEICEIYQPKTITQEDLKEDGAYLVYGANGVIGRYDKFNHEFPEVTVTCRGATCGTVNYATAKSWITGNAMVFSPKIETLLKDYLYLVLKYSDLSSTISGSAQPQITRQSIAPYQIPLPPLEVQREIVAEIEGYQKVINGARAVLDHYRPHIPIHPDWPMVELGEAADFISGFAFKSTDMTATPVDDTYRRVVKIGNVGRDGQLDIADAQFHAYSGDLARFVLKVGDVVMAMTGATVGKVAIVNEDGFLLNQRVGVLRAKATALQNFVLHLLCSAEFYNFCQRTAGGGAQGNISPSEILKYKVPLPPLATQRAIVAEIEAEQALVSANRELITRFEQKIQTTLARIWGEETSSQVSKE